MAWNAKDIMFYYYLNNNKVKCHELTIYIQNNLVPDLNNWRSTEKGKYNNNNCN